MLWQQHDITLKPYPRGFHLVTGDIIAGAPSIADVGAGLMHLFILHTSASVTINENADPTVRSDMESQFNMIAPEDQPYYRHTIEGSDDMPAHIKSSLLGSGLSVPITDGKLRLGTWQGIYLCEHRNNGGARRLVVTVLGTTRD